MSPTTLKELTTFRIGGPIGAFLEVVEEAEFTDAIRGADESGTPLLVVGGGSNILASDEGFAGIVVHDARRQVTCTAAGDTGDTVLVTASAGMVWDEFVSWSLDEGLSGIEALSGIPGTVGAAPVQNVGAYGHEISDTLESIVAWDRAVGRALRIPAKDLELSYRDSRIKRSLHEGDSQGRVWGPTGRWVVLEARFALKKSALSAPILYRELAGRLGVDPGERADAGLVRETVIALRTSKGMVLDAEDHDTWSAGSFFTNPILSAAQVRCLPDEAPRFKQADSTVKTSAAWLIDHAGFGKGYALAGARPEGAAVSFKHVLALTNRGSASAGEVVELALRIREGVEERFGVRLVPEPVGVGIHW